MRITDLLDKRSISLDAAPKTKSEALDMAVDLMVKSEKISDQIKGLDINSLTPIEALNKLNEIKKITGI